MTYATPKTVPRSQVSSKELSKTIPRYHVLLLDDNDHPYEYVVEMLCKLFRHSRTDAWRMAQQVDRGARCIVYTTSKEQAELKCSQIHSYGADWRLSRSQGSMSAVIEEAD